MPAAAHAEWMLTPFIGLKFGGDTNLVDLEQGASNAKLTLGASVAVLSDNILGVEGEIGHTPRFFERSTGNLIARSNVTTLMGSVLFAVPRAITQESLRPYAVAGIGLVRVSIDDVADLLPVRGNILGITLGGGIIGQLTNRTSLRADVRHIRDVRGTPQLVGFGSLTEISYWRATVGVALLGSLF